MKDETLPLDTVLHGDSLAVLKTLPDNSVDSVVTDPPAGIAFMNREWDTDKGGRDAWIAWMTDIFTEVWRVTKPGGHAFVWALPRTSHWTATALENAGWEIREVITHLFGQGFPKSLDISKAIDKMQGVEREIVGKHPQPLTKSDTGRYQWNTGNVGKTETYITAPSTPQAQQWDGYGTALKPSSEHWILCRKPLSERNIAANVLRWGTGGLNIDASRINPGEQVPGGGRSWGASSGTHEGWKRPAHEHYENKQPHTQGRWPANTLLSHSPACRRIGTKRVRGNASGRNTEESHTNTYGWANGGIWKSGIHYGDETVESYDCAEDCPVRALDRQSGVSRTKRNEKPSECGGNTWGGTIQIHRGARGYTDEGTASRYFHTFTPDELEAPFLYAAKASSRERSEGLAEMVALRQDLTEEQRTWVLQELEKAGVRTYE